MWEISANTTRAARPTRSWPHPPEPLARAMPIHRPESNDVHAKILLWVCVQCSRLVATDNWCFSTKMCQRPTANGTISTVHLTVVQILQTVRQDKSNYQPDLDSTNSVNEWLRSGQICHWELVCSEWLGHTSFHWIRSNVTQGHPAFHKDIEKCRPRHGQAILSLHKAFYISKGTQGRFVV